MDDLNYWLALHHALHHTPTTIHRLLEHYCCPKKIINAFEQTQPRFKLTDSQRQRLKSPNWGAIKKERLWESTNPLHHILPISSPHYPVQLREIYDPPIILYIIGSPEIAQVPQLAIVGTRKPSFSAQEIAFEFAAKLSQSGMLITSGLALGIDACAHNGALSVNAATIAVLGCGVDTVYPKRHHKLYAQISTNGALISEFPIGTQPDSKNFPRRNRIISGLSLGTLVVEAAVRSGSLITARCSNEQGREVFAVPGSIRNPLTRGCHHLIREGAKLTQTISDILEEFGMNSAPNLTPKKTPSPKKLDPIDNKLLECLGFDAESAQTLIRATGLTAQNVRSRLFNLELHGYIKTVPGGYCRVKL